MRRLRVGIDNKLMRGKGKNERKEKARALSDENQDFNKQNEVL